MPIIGQTIGRKWGYITACICIMLGWILAYTASNAAEILLSESFHGLGTNSLITACYIAMTEMLTPMYRHTSMQAFGIAQGVGMATCGILGRYLHYQTVSLIMLVPILTAIALALLWLESPSWLACRGEFDKCEEAFVKLRGVDELSQKELLQLISAQKENLSCTAPKPFTLQAFWKKMARKDFYKPITHIFVVLLIMFWGGVDAIYVYFIEIVKKATTSDDAVFYASIIMYIIVLGGFCITNLVMRKYKHKTVLFCSACATVVCLLISSIISGLQTAGVLSENSLLLMYSLIAYTACSSIGFHSIVFIIAVELIPVKHRSEGGVLLIISHCMLYASSLKFSPYITQYLGLWCTFLIYAINISTCLWFISKYVPETKGRSLQEIEDYYMFGKFTQRSVEEESAHNYLTTPTAL